MWILCRSDIWMIRKCFLFSSDLTPNLKERLLWSLSYVSRIYNYLCNRWLSPQKLWVRIPLTVRCARYNIIWSSLSVTCGRSVVFSGNPVSFTNKTDLHDITEILLKLSLNTLTLTPIWRPCNMIFVWLKCEKWSLNWTITFLKWSMYQNISLFRFGQTTSIAALENYFR